MLPQKLAVVEVGLRDGLQSVVEPLSTDRKVRLVELMLEAGVRRIEAVSFAHPAVLPQLADAEAVMARVPRDPSVTYRGLAPNSAGTYRAIDAGVDEVVGLVCCDEKITELNQRNSIRGVLDDLRESALLARSADIGIVAAIAMAFFAYGSGPVPLERLQYVTDEVVAAGVRRFYVADSAGMADPRQVYETLRHLKLRHPECEVGVHLHTRNGLAMANTLAAMMADADWFESSFCGIGGDLWFPGDPEVLGNTPTEDLLALCDYLGVITGIDSDRYTQVASLAEEYTGRRSIAYRTRGGSRDQMSTVDWDTLLTQPGKQIRSSS